MLGQGPPKKTTRKRPVPSEICKAKLAKLDWLYEALTVHNATFFALCYPSFQGDGKNKQKKRRAILHIIQHWPVRQKALERIRVSQSYYRRQLSLRLSM